MALKESIYRKGEALIRYDKFNEKKRKRCVENTVTCYTGVCRSDYQEDKSREKWPISQRAFGGTGSNKAGPQPLGGKKSPPV